MRSPALPGASNCLIPYESMMKYFTNLYHFLGGVLFAIILIAATAILVIAGTFMESHTGSHQYADKNIYGTPLFSILLWGFFINILFAAFGRWPFRKKHTPFLITHWGLLMILGGTLVKHYAGTQGTMFLMEGSATDQVMVPGSEAIRIDTPEKTIPTYLNIPFTPNTQRIGEAEITLQQRFPHSQERLDSFIKGNWVVMAGVPPFPLETAVQAKFDEKEWTLLAKRTSSVEMEAFNNYAANTILRLGDPSTGETVLESPLKDVLKGAVTAAGDTLTAELQLNHSSITGFNNPRLQLCFNNESIEIPLSGPHALFNLASDPAMGSAPIEVNLLTKPKLLFLQDDHGDTMWLPSDPMGTFIHTHFAPTT